MYDNVIKNVCMNVVLVDFVRHGKSIMAVLIFVYSKLYTEKRMYEIGRSFKQGQ